MSSNPAISIEVQQITAWSDYEKMWNGKPPQNMVQGMGQTSSPWSWIKIPLQQVKAEDWSKIVVRMKVLPASAAQDECQLYWATTASKISKENSLKVPVEIDGQFHDYTFDVKDVKNWRDNITDLHFVPLSSGGKKIEIEFIRMKK